MTKIFDTGAKRYQTPSITNVPTTTTTSTNLTTTTVVPEMQQPVLFQVAHDGLSTEKKKKQQANDHLEDKKDLDGGSTIYGDFFDEKSEKSSGEKPSESTQDQETKTPKPK